MSPSRLRKRTLSDAQFSVLLIIPLLIFLVSMVIYPLGYSFWLSLNDVNFLIRSYRFVGLAQYSSIFNDPILMNSLAITVRFAMESTIISVLLALGMALILNEAIPGRGVLRAVVILPWALSAYATAMLWKFLLSANFGFYNGVLFGLGLISSYVEFLDRSTVVESLAMVFAWRTAPLAAFFLLAGLQTAPHELYKSAKTDGAGPFRRFIYVTLPHIRYPLLISIVLVTMLAAKELDTIFVMTSGGPVGASKVLTYFVYEKTFVELNGGMGAAISYVLILVMLMIGTTYFLVLTRRGR